MAWENIFNITAGIIGLFALIMAISNLLFLQKKSLRPLKKTGPKVSVLIPTRNEENSIPRCLDSLLKQTYTNYEILVLDDGSEDSTWDILSSYAEKTKKIRIIKGRPLPDGWYGKNHALHQLAELADGDLYLFTDADTIHSTNSISFAVTNMEAHGIDFLSGYPRQQSGSRSSAAVISLMFLNLLFFNPVWTHRIIPVPFLSLVLGQFLCIRAAAYHKTGGYAAIPKVLTDDIHMGRLLVENGFRQLFLNVGAVVSCRTYQNLEASIRGITKCMVDFFDRKILLLLLLMPVFFTAAVLPTWTCIYLLVFSPLSVPVFLYIGVASLFAGWSLVILYNHLPLFTALLYPFTFLLLLFLLIKGIHATISNTGFIWKNRIVK